MSDTGVVERRLVAATARAVSFVRERPWPLVVWLTMLGWAIVLLMLFRSYFQEFRFARYDLGNMVQAVWSTAHGRPLETTLGTGEQAARLAAHADPILILLAPFWILAPTPSALAAVQIVVCAAGALPTFWLGRRHLGSEKAAALLAVAYLVYPWLAWTALDGVHPVTLAIPLFLFAIWFLDTHRHWAFAACAVLIAATGELMGVPLAVLGVWYWLAYGRGRGLVIAVAGLAWTVVAIKVVVPHFQGGDSPFYTYFEHVGGSPEGVLRTLFTEPASILQTLFTSADLLYVAALTVPLLGAFVLTPGLAICAVPVLAANGLASIGLATDPRGHHVAGILPFLIAGSVLGIARLPDARRVKAAAAVLVMCGAFSIAIGPWPTPYGREDRWPYGVPSADNVEALREAVAMIPEAAPVAATNRAGSHLSARRYFFSIPRVGNAEWIVLDMKDVWVPLPPRKVIRTSWGRKDPVVLEKFKTRIERSSAWRKMYEKGGVLVFERVRT